MLGSLPLAVDPRLSPSSPSPAVSHDWPTPGHFQVCQFTYKTKSSSRVAGLMDSCLCKCLEIAKLPSIAAGPTHTGISRVRPPRSPSRSVVLSFVVKELDRGSTWSSYRADPRPALSLLHMTEGAEKPAAAEHHQGWAAQEGSGLF